MHQSGCFIQCGYTFRQRGIELHPPFFAASSAGAASGAIFTNHWSDSRLATVPQRWQWPTDSRGLVFEAGIAERRDDPLAPRTGEGPRSRRRFVHTPRRPSPRRRPCAWPITKSLGSARASP
jgi:hypothetical protein